MDKQLDSTLSAIRSRSLSLSDSDRGNLHKALVCLAELLREPEDRSTSNDLLRISKYLSRFRSSDDGRSETSSAKELLELARLSAHSKWRFSPEDFRRLQKPFWKALESNADIWRPKELSNLLSYSLRRNIRIGLEPDTTSKTVVRIYHEYFRSLHSRERDHVFEELLQRVLSEPAFRRALADEPFR